MVALQVSVFTEEMSIFEVMFTFGQTRIASSKTISMAQYLSLCDSGA
jgi:hypothetical protein